MAISLAPSPMANVTLEESNSLTALTILAFCAGEALQQITECAFTPSAMNKDKRVGSSSKLLSVLPSITTTQCATFPASTSNSAAAILLEISSNPSSIDKIITVE
ncbi:unnamed protein product [[Candida] boidinii]|nr:unnamed protein product [[Candida] boidinii]